MWCSLLCEIFCGALSDARVSFLLCSVLATASRDIALVKQCRRQMVAVLKWQHTACVCFSLSLLQRPVSFSHVLSLTLILSHQQTHWLFISLELASGNVGNWRCRRSHRRCRCRPFYLLLSLARHVLHPHTLTRTDWLPVCCLLSLIHLA